MEWLAYLHPVWMVASLTLAALALQRGLVLRASRHRRRRRTPLDVAAHVRLARPAVLVLAIGFVGGPLSMWWLRDRSPFGTLHAMFGSLAILGFIATAWLGRRLERGEGDAVVHGIVATLAILLAGAAAVAGFVLLP